MTEQQLEERRAKQRAYYYRNHEQTLKRRAANRKAKPERIKAERARFRAKHLNEVRAQERAWREAHPELMREYQRAYERRVGLEQTRARKRQVQREMYRRDPKKLREQAIAWRHANPDRAAEAYARSRVKRTAAKVTGKVTRSEIWARDGGSCHICGLAADPNYWHLDHVVPLARGGVHGPDNVAVSHPRCNQRKHTSLLEEIAL